ncbi:MAG: hypothetical protein ACLFTK_04335 [Anaerolineales bacterium]
MSGISFHFQLDPDKPDEARALELLEAWQYSGWNLQKIIVAALLTMAQSNPPKTENVELHDILNMLHAQNTEALQHLYTLLQQVQTLVNADYAHQGTPQPGTPDEPREAVSPSFIASVKKAMRPGMSLEEDD